MTIFSELAIDAVRLAINSAIIGSLIALSAAAAFRLAPSLHPRIRYAIAVGAFLAAVIFPVFATFQIFDGNQPLTLVVQNSEIESPEKTRFESANDFAVRPSLNQTLNQNPSPAEAFSGEIPSKNPVIKISPTLSNIFLLLWLIVAFLLLAREIFGHLSFAGKRRKWRAADESLCRELQIPENARVYLSDGESPLAIGVFRPAIVLPARLCDDVHVEMTRQIVRHELNHLQWRDPTVNALLRIVRALFWINPPLWFLERAARMEREAAADFAVVENDNFDAEKIAEYANALVEMAKRDSTARREFKFVAAEIGTRSGLEKRVRRLFQAPTRLNFLRRTLAVSAVCAGLSGTYFLPLASPANSSANALIVAESGAENFSPPTSTENIEPEILSLDNSSTLPPNRISESFAQTLRYITDQPEAERVENKLENIDAGENLNETPQPGLPSENANSENNAPVAPVNTGEYSAAVAPAPPNIETAPPTEQPAPKNYEAPPNFIRDGMASVGYPDLSDEEIAALKRVGASHFTVREFASVGYTNLPLKTLIRLRENGVSAAFIREMKASGYDNLSTEMLIDFRWHGVSAVYIREMASLGYGNLSAKTLVAFRRHSVSASYINEMRALVKGGISADEIVDMKWLAVSREFIGEFAAVGYKNLTANQLISMRQHGVTTAFIEKMRARDGKNYSANDLISLRMNGER
jgi:beta-lactamase regulating signal transducer with metallopeptidase domain